jgi:hypothetical protein
MTHFDSRPSPARNRAIPASGGRESLDPVGVFCIARAIDGGGMGRIQFIVTM